MASSHNSELRRARKRLPQPWSRPTSPSPEPQPRAPPSLPPTEMLRDSLATVKCDSGCTHDRRVPKCLWCLESPSGATWTRDYAGALKARPASPMLPSSRPSSRDQQYQYNPPAKQVTSPTEPRPQPHSHPHMLSRSPSPSLDSHSPSVYQHHQSFAFNPHQSYNQSLSPPSSRPSTPDSAMACQQQPQKYGAYVARKSAQRQSSLARRAERASVHAVAVPQPQTPPSVAPTPGAIALGLLLPIHGALEFSPDYDPRRASVNSSSSRRTSAVPSLVSSASTRRSEERQSMESTRRVRFSRDLRNTPRDTPVEAALPSVPEHKSQNAFSRLTKRVSSVFKLKRRSSDLPQAQAQAVAQARDCA